MSDSYRYEGWHFEGNAVLDENRLTVAVVVTEDDGKLIAAAPQMHAALREARDVLRQACHDGHAWAAQAAYRANAAIDAAEDGS